MEYAQISCILFFLFSADFDVVSCEQPLIVTLWRGGDEDAYAMPWSDSETASKVEAFVSSDNVSLQFHLQGTLSPRTKLTPQSMESTGPSSAVVLEVIVPPVKTHVLLWAHVLYLESTHFLPLLVGQWIIQPSHPPAKSIQSY